MVNVFDLRDLIRMQIQHIQLIQILQIPYPLNIVLPEHQYSQRRDRVQMRNFLDLIVVKIEEDQIREGDEVFDLADVVVLEVEETESFFAFEEGHVGEFAFVEV